MRRARHPPANTRSRHAARQRGPGTRGAADCSPARGCGRGTRRRHRLVRRRTAGGRRHPAGAVATEPHSRSGSPSAPRPGRTRRHQSLDLRRRGPARALLCAGPVVATRVHHRRQRRGEFRRRPLPQVRPHGPQPARTGGRYLGWRTHHGRFAAGRGAGTLAAAAADGLRRHARRRRRGDCQAGAAARAYRTGHGLVR